MAEISIAITTPTALILDPDGRAATGTVTIKPNAPFQYTSGSVYQVTDETIQIAISEGMIVGTLELAPNDGASNLPVTYYTVTIDVNTVTWTEYWQLQNTPTSLTWGEVTRVAGPNAAAPNALAALLAAPNPLPVYVRQEETLDAPAIGSYNGRGGIPRVDPATGLIPASFMPSTYDAFASGTRLLFHQTAAPTGWTKDTTTTYNGAMIVGTTGSVSSGGSADPTATHTHTGPSHTHTGPSHAHLVDDSTGTTFPNVTFGGVNSITGLNATTQTSSGGTGNTGASGTGNTGANTAPKYYSVIVAAKN